MKVERLVIYDLSRRYRQPSIIAFRTQFYVKHLLVILETDEGIVGYGEAASDPDFSLDTQEEAFRFLSGISSELVGMDPCDIIEVHRFLGDASQKLGVKSQSAKAAIDFACYDILGKVQNKPIYQLLGQNEPRIVPNTLTVGLGSPREMVKEAKAFMRRFGKKGLNRIKLKLEGNPEMDIKRVLAVAEALPCELTLDANQGYRNPKTAVEVLNELYGVLGKRIVLIEQPCPKKDLEKLKFVSDNSEIPVFADESMVDLEDAKKLVKLKAVKGLWIKLAKVGGIYWGRKVAELGEISNVGVGVGPGGSGVGVAAAANFVAGTKNVIASDLDSDYYFRTDIVTKGTRPRIYKGGRIPSGKPGLGVTLREYVTEIISIRQLFPPVGEPIQVIAGFKT